MMNWIINDGLSHRAFYRSFDLFSFVLLSLCRVGFPSSGSGPRPACPVSHRFLQNGTCPNVALSLARRASPSSSRCQRTAALNGPLILPRFSLSGQACFSFFRTPGCLRPFLPSLPAGVRGQSPRPLPPPLLPPQLLLSALLSAPPFRKAKAKKTPAGKRAGAGKASRRRNYFGASVLAYSSTSAA